MLAGAREEAGIQILLAFGLLVVLFYAFAAAYFYAEKAVKWATKTVESPPPIPSPDADALAKERLLAAYGSADETWPAFRFRVQAYEGAVEPWNYRGETEEEYITRILTAAGIQPRK